MLAPDHQAGRNMATPIQLVDYARGNGVMPNGAVERAA